MSERELVYDIRLALSRGVVRLMRNNVGALQDRTGKYVTYGLGVGTADLIGWRSFVIQPEDVGETIAVFVGIEVKSERGVLTAEQIAFIETVLSSGGVAGVVRTVDEAKKLLGID